MHFANMFFTLSFIQEIKKLWTCVDGNFMFAKEAKLTPGQDDDDIKNLLENSIRRFISLDTKGAQSLERRRVLTEAQSELQWLAWCINSSSEGKPSAPKD
jgi:hypothetical protein